MNIRSTAATLLAGLAAATLTLTACGGGDNGNPAAASSCEPVSQEKLNRIADGADKGLEFELADGAAFRSPDHDKVWLIAARMHDGSLGNDVQIGVWASNSLDLDGTILAVNNMAQRFTHWPDAEKPAGIGPVDPLVKNATDCL